jgi:DNA-binding CsgD family transcriptional regulator
MADAIVGRAAEQADLLRLLGELPDSGAAVVLRGEAGVGKSTLLEWAARQTGALVLTVTGVQAEFDIAYAGLHRLIGQLPPSDRRATVLAAIDTQPSPARVGLEVLDLVTAAGPVLIVVDDAQWLDGPSWDALTFVARRLHHDPVLLLAAMRDGVASDTRLERAGLTEVRVEPLATGPAAALLDARAPALRADLRGRVLAEAAGNPLGLVELAGVAARYGAAGLPPAVLPLPARLERAFAQAVAELPAPTRDLLLVAALNDGSGIDEIITAAALLGEGRVDADDFAPAVAARLIELDDLSQVRFRHPLVRSALRQGGSLARRRAAHAALAQALTGRPERQVWHRAEAASGPDEQLAADLTAAADEARRRGAGAVAVAALERAAQLSEDQEEAASRVLWAAVAAGEVGDMEATRRLLQGLESRPLRAVERAHLAWLREIYFGTGWSGATRMRSFMDIVDRMRKNGDRKLAMDSLVAVSLRCFWSNPGRETRDLVVAAAERLRADPMDRRLVSVLSLVAPLEQVGAVLPRIVALASELDAESDELHLMATAAGALGDFPTSLIFAGAAVTATRAQGLLGLLAQALHEQASFAAQLADVRLAVAAATEARDLALETGQPLWAVTVDLVRGYAEALRGNAATALALAEAGETVILSMGANPLLAYVEMVRGVAALADGRYHEAYDHLHRLFDPADVPYHPVVRLWMVSHLAEAAVAGGRTDDLRALVDELDPIGPFPVLGVARNLCRALLAADDDAEAAFESALTFGPLAAWPFERARLQHSYGVWLRRRRRGVESRPYLRAAAGTFDALGARPWADRSRAELRASGERINRVPDARDQLTPQELQIATLAAGGLTNREIAERLFLSPRTIGSHLYRIFPKLGITSRGEVAVALNIRT